MPTIQSAVQSTIQVRITIQVHPTVIAVQTVQIPAVQVARIAVVHTVQVPTVPPAVPLGHKFTRQRQIALGFLHCSFNGRMIPVNYLCLSLLINIDDRRNCRDVHLFRKRMRIEFIHLSFFHLDMLTELLTHGPPLWQKHLTWVACWRVHQMDLWFRTVPAHPIL